jgi:hypothetical protein
MTKSELKGNTYKTLRIVKGLSVEDIPAIRENILSQIEGIDGASMNETETSFDISNGQFILKPVQKRETIGKLVCGASYASFNGARIEYKDMDLHAEMCSFETSNATYSIHANI